MSSINFISEDTLEEKRKKRQEDWEKVRKESDPEEVPEEAVDRRTLYDRLQEQKMAKEAEKEEASKMRNMVQGLKKDETDFLDFVATRQLKHDREREMEEERLLREVSEARVKLMAEETNFSPGENSKSASTKTLIGAAKRTNQTALLAGVVKRSRPSTSDDKDGEGALRRVSSSSKDKEDDSKDRDDDSKDRDDNAKSVKDEVGNGVARVVGVLPGIGEYTDSSGSESEVEEEKIDMKTLTFIKNASKKKPKANQ